MAKHPEKRPVMITSAIIKVQEIVDSNRQETTTEQTLP